MLSANRLVSQYKPNQPIISLVRPRGWKCKKKNKNKSPRHNISHLSFICSTLKELQCDVREAKDKLSVFSEKKYKNK